ncbi:MAG: hypothetical protein ACRDMH_15635 [Solirubrobacterales bacterium]
MADDKQLDVMIAVYAMGGLAESDYDAIVDLVEAKTAKGVLLATQDVMGEATQVQEAGATPFGDGPEAGPEKGVGKVKDKVRAVKDKVEHKGKGKIEEKLGEKLGKKLSPGSGMMIAVYEHAGADSVALAVRNPLFASAASVDGHGPKALKAALEEAQAGLPSG